MREITRCLACDSSYLKPYLNLGIHQLANTYTKEPQDLPRYPLQVNFCEDCTHSQLSVTVDPSEMFSDYKYVSGTTTTLRNYFSEVAVDLLAEIRPVHGRISVLDIGANDGSLLEAFRDRGCFVYGVDPAENLIPISQAKGITVLCDFWRQEITHKLGATFDLILAFNCFAHNYDPLGFLMACREVLRDGGKVILEMPYNPKSLSECQLGQTYHEHISYYNIRSMMHIACRSGFRIANVKMTPVHGGSVRFTLEEGKQHSPLVVEMMNNLEDHMTYDYHVEVAEKILANYRRLEEVLRDISKTHKVVAYGASAKFATVSSTFNLPVAYIVDDNELKCGLVGPNKLPIIPTKSIRDDCYPLCFLITAFNFKEEILKKIRSYRPAGFKWDDNDPEDLYVLEVPTVEVSQLHG
jgi:SAM-dependent methyltransferase